MSWRTVETLDSGVVAIGPESWDIFPIGDIVGSGFDSRSLSFTALCDGEFELRLTYDIPTDEYTASGSVTINGISQTPTLISNSGGTPDSAIYNYSNGDVIILEGSYDINDYGGSYFVNLAIISQECYTSTTTPPPTTTGTTTTPAPSSTTTPSPSATTTTTETTEPPPPTSTTQTPTTSCCPCSCICVLPEPSTTPSFPPAIPILTTRTVPPIFIVTSTPSPINPLTDFIITTPPPTTITTTTTTSTTTTVTTTIIVCESPCNNLGF